MTTPAVTYFQSATSSFRATSRSVDDDIFSTHPSFVVRCRALLWFSASNLMSLELNFVSLDHTEKEKLDRRVQVDLDRFVNGPARQQIESAKSDLSLWMAATKLVEKGRFSRDDQLVVRETFGEQTAKSLKEFLADTNPDELGSTVFEKLQEARNTLSQLIPLSFLKEYQKLENSIAGLFST